MPNQYADNALTAHAVQTLNVRSGDNTNCKVLAQLPAGSEVSVVSCTLANGAASSWCQIESGRAGPSFVAKRLLSFEDVATVEEADPSDYESPPPVMRGRGRPHGDVILQLPDDNGDISSDMGDLSNDDLPDSQSDSAPALHTGSSANDIDCNDPRLFNSRIRNLVCASAQ
jgi:hypothetical protein